GSAAYGLQQLEQRVRRGLADEGPARIVFTSRPANMVGITDAALSAFADVPWSHPALCRDIAGALRATGWVRDVERVHRYPDRRIEVTCTFREPVAMVNTNRGCCLVDGDCVRLPGWYTNDPAFKLIVGITEPPPGAGEKWAATGLQAAVELVELLADEYYTDQITGILVDVRETKIGTRVPQLTLATDRAGGRIVWGSPIGDEIEENTADQKLNLLRGNYRRFGRVDADRAVLDVSVHPDRILTPASTSARRESLAGL
ncbi:MAG TPA: hypothetical protein P5572_12590, partial [Phycisphaerae bacterium]|nr:hypothetical protein [Phycisphaerae bacterium]